MLLEYLTHRRFYLLIAFYQIDLLLQDVPSEISNVLCLLLQVHQFEGSGVLQIADRLVEPLLKQVYIV